jgi:ligand-binding sensor domain-containing protein/signal transduction histidine kinase
VLVLICFANAASALDPSRTLSQYVYDRWGADRGFIGGRISAIGQSADGYLWIGTERGLVRFDGFSFTLIQRPLPDSAPTGPVRSLLSDAEGNLWIRLDGPRILLYRQGRFEDLYSRFDLRDTIFTATAPDNEGGVLLSGLGERTLRYRNGHMETVVSSDDNPGTVIALAATRDRRVWLGTRDTGLFRAGGGLIAQVAQELKDTKINSLLPASNGGLWIGTDQGIRFWDGSRLAALNLPYAIGQLQILAMTKDRDDNVWVGTSHGILRIGPSGTVALDQLNPRPEYQVTAVFEDRDGDIWFGGSRGIERLRNGMFTTYSISDGLPSNGIGPVYVDSQVRTWFAPLSGGLYWLKDGKVGKVTIGGLDHDVVYSISGGAGEVWLGRQRGGLTLLTTMGDSFVARTYTQADGLAQNSVYSVHRDRDGAVWAGTVNAGVSRLQGGRFTNTSESNGLPSNAINSIAEGFDGTTWFATPNGLVSLARGQWTNRSARDGLPSSNIRSIFEDTKHVLWIATSGGLACLSSGQVTLLQKLPEGLREQIFGIAEDGIGSLWFTTSDHVLQVNRDRLLEGSLMDTDIQSYGIGDGLRGIEGVGRERTVVSDHLGRIWVSLNSGLSVADPKLNASSALPITVRMESISAGGSQVDARTPGKLPSGIQSIILNYAGTNLSVPDRTRFRYKLDGSDHGWSDIVASRQVVYSNLGPGSYRFRIVGSNGNDLWNGPETAVSFVIEPAFWQTWWFQMVCVAACLLAAMVFYHLRMYQLAQTLNLRFQDRLAERTRIAQELHDTLLQGVLSASLQLDVAEDQLPENSPVKPLLRRILQLMGKVTEEGRNAVQGLRASDTRNQGIEVAFSRMRQEFALDDKIGYRVIVNSVTRPLRPIIRDEAYRIGREALVNAFMHAHAHSIEVEVEYTSRYFRIIVRDDGCGIDPQVLDGGREGHWGLPGMRERSESIGASLRLRSRIGAGTEVELTVPDRIAFENNSNRPISTWFQWISREKFETPESHREKRVKK